MVLIEKSPIASAIPYDPTGTDLLSLDVQSAITELHDALAGGVLNYSLTDTANFSTTSATDVAVTGMSLTPASGTYAVWFNAEFTSNQNSAINYVSFYKGGTQVTDSQRGTAAPQSAPTPALISSMAIVSFNGSQVCEVRARRSAGTFILKYKSLLLIRLGPA